ncbi:O-antigen ligase family protein [Svornostia abyssi]|uniref:O-antigen ligase family protein n=1 Tax=Svornostia abyssi TaxID=2898438 RepID=A0ABY5PLW6_9ACTN|nr:O-antigen ligase family protein [Parviterribacteraceae bacterium J379]
MSGALVLWTLGTVDDRRSLPWSFRVAVEALLAAGLWALGLGWDLGLGELVSLTVTVAWVLAVTNAFNLFDNMDGASGTMGLVIAGAVSALGVLQDDVWLAASSAALAGACLGFLPHNLARPRARIFLGDGGSLPIGFVLAAVIMIGAQDLVAPWQGLIVGLLLVAVPALDTVLITVSRRRRGLSVLTGGQDHLTHRTAWLVSSAHWVCLVLGGAQALVSALVIVAIQGESDLLVVLVLAFLVVAAGTIALCERERLRDRLAAASAAPDAGVRRARMRPYPSYALLAVLGLGAGLSPFFGGYYEAGLWVPMGLAIVAVTAVGLIARPLLLRTSAAVALAALTLFALWALLSARWTDAVALAIVTADRWLVLVALLTVLLLVIRSDARAVWALGCAGVGLLIVAASVVLRLLGSDPGSLLLDGRLNEPLGYINGGGAAYAAGLFLALALAEQRRPVLAGPGAAALALFSGLALLTQSRGTLLAVAGTLVVVLAVVPGRARRAGALLVGFGAVALLSGPLLHVYDVAADARLEPGDGRAAGLALLAATVLGGAIWASLAAVLERRPSPAWWSPPRWAVVGLIAVSFAGVLAAGAASADRVRAQVDAFTELDEDGRPAADQSRLLSGSGNRYDFWRVAVNAWRDKPVAGLGAGGYRAAYLQERQAPEEVGQPHSLQLQALSELGLVGGLLLLTCVAAVVVGAVPVLRRAGRSPRARAVAVGGIGLSASWLLQTSVDWLHLFPGLTALALLGTAALLHAEQDDPGAPPVVRGRAGPALAVLVAAALVIAGALLTRQGLTDVYTTRAQEALAEDPTTAQVESRRALRLDPHTVAAGYTLAAAHARQGDAAGAIAALQETIRRDQSTPVTWELLGDVYLRRGRVLEARRAYALALARNPRSPRLAALAADPTGDRAP